MLSSPVSESKSRVARNFAGKGSDGEDAGKGSGGDDPGKGGGGEDTGKCTLWGWEV